MYGYSVAILPFRATELPGEKDEVYIKDACYVMYLSYLHI